MRPSRIFALCAALLLALPYAASADEIDAAIERLSSPDRAEREAAAALLRARGAPAIGRAIGLASQRAGGTCVTALAAIGKPAVPDIVAAAERAGTDLERMWLVLSLGKIGPDAAEGAPLLARLVERRGDDKRVTRTLRCDAARALGAIGPAARGAGLPTATAAARERTVIAALERGALSAPEPALQVEAARSLGRIGGPLALDALVRILAAARAERGDGVEPGPEARAAVGDALAALAPEDRARLPSLARSPVDGVRLAALEALSRLGLRDPGLEAPDPAAIDAFRDALRVPGRDARAEALRSLSRSPEARSLVLASLLRDPSAAVRRRAATALREPTSLLLARPALSAALDDPDPAVRYEARRSLGALGRRALPALIARLLDPDGTPAARAGAARAIGHIERRIAPRTAAGRPRGTPPPAGPAARDALVAACAPAEPPLVRHAAADALRDAGLTPPFDAHGGATLDDEDEALLATLDGLGLPSFAGVRLARVQAQPCDGGAAAPERRDLVFLSGGDRILLEDGADAVRVLSIDLRERRIERWGARGFRVVVAPLGLERAAVDVLQPGSSRLLDLESEPWASDVPQAIELLVLARVCAENGKGAAAHALVRRAVAVEPLIARYDGVRHRTRSPSLRERIEDAAGRVELSRDLRRQAEGTLSRAELLERLRDFDARFPECGSAAWAADIAQVLAIMVDEDERRARRAPLGADATPAERAADLVFALRDVVADEPGGQAILDTPPARALAALGPDAVPALLDAACDERLTRVWVPAGLKDDPSIVRVGDCAILVLEEIACRRFPAFRGEYGLMRPPDIDSLVERRWAAAIEAGARTWWESVRDRSLAGILDEGARSGTEDGLRAAVRLATERPAGAIDAVVEGARSAATRDVEEGYLLAAAHLGGPTATALLLEELHAEAAVVRVLAARALEAQGDPRGVAAMVDEWREWARWSRPEVPSQVDPAARTLPRRVPVMFDEGGFPIRDVVSTLIGAGTPDAIDALSRELALVPPVVRAHVIRQLDPDAVHAGPSLRSPAEDLYPDLALHATPRAPTAGAELAIEALLVRALDDPAPLPGARPDERICDAAAHALAARYPGRHRFHLGAASGARDREIVEARERWEDAHGPLAPWPAQPPGRGAASGVLAVRTVAVRRGENAPATEAFAAARALAGTTLTAGAVVDVLTGFARGAPRRQEIVLTLERPEGAPGFTATLVLSRVIPARMQDGWVRDDQVRVGDDDALRTETTELGAADPRDPATHAPLAAAIERALAAPPSAEVWIQVRLTTGLDGGE